MMRITFIHLLGMLSILLVGVEAYPINDNELIGLKSSDGVYVFILGALLLLAAMLKAIPNRN